MARGDGDALALAAGELDAAFADDGFRTARGSARQISSTRAMRQGLP